MMLNTYCLRSPVSSLWKTGLSSICFVTSHGLWRHNTCFRYMRVTFEATNFNVSRRSFYVTRPVVCVCACFCNQPILLCLFARGKEVLAHFRHFVSTLNFVARLLIGGIKLQVVWWRLCFVHYTSLVDINTVCVINRKLSSQYCDHRTLFCKTYYWHNILFVRF
jgi:hypothetical protein